MTRPVSDIVQMQFQNPDATAPLILPVQVICNTPDEDLYRNIEVNSARDLPWVGFEEPHDGIAVIVGGGPSVAEHLDKIIEFSAGRADVFALNGASQWLRERGIDCTAQIVADAKPETAMLIDPLAWGHLLASQVNPECFDVASINGDYFDRSSRLKVWHLGIEGMETRFPPERVKRGGYALVGGGAAVGNSAICLAYVMGYREMHLFGFDSCHRDGESHAYDQPMNRFIPSVDVEWGGKTFHASVAMKAQAEKFQITGRVLQQNGVSLHLYGDGLLQTMWNTKPQDLQERDKYRLMWRTESYREVSPGEDLVDTFLHVANPHGLIIDFGCGTGRAALKLNEAGHDVCLVDFADNCRDEEVIGLPFLEWDMNHPCPLRGNFGYCTDVMEHIPHRDVSTVIRNIMASAPTTFFQISTVPDVMGGLIGQPLHLTVYPLRWWESMFETIGFNVVWSDHDENSCQLLVTAPSQKGQ